MNRRKLIAALAALPLAPLAAVAAPATSTGWQSARELGVALEALEVEKDWRALFIGEPLPWKYKSWRT